MAGEDWFWVSPALRAGTAQSPASPFLIKANYSSLAVFRHRAACGDVSMPKGHTARLLTLNIE